MGWNEVDDKHKKYTDKMFVSCSERHEIDYLKKAIKEEFPWLTQAEIGNAIVDCCASVPPPRPRDKFIGCLKKKLDGI